MKDLKLALRSLVRTPGFTIVAVVTLALGIGANTAIFTVIQGVLLQPLPYDEPEQLVRFWSKWNQFADVYGWPARARDRRSHGPRCADKRCSPTRLAPRPRDDRRGIRFVAALALTRVMESLLFGVGARDPMTFVAVAPAWRAARVDPIGRVAL